MILYKVVIIMGVVILFLTTILYGVRFKKESRSLKIFFIYLLGLLINDVISKYLWINKVENLAVLHLFNYFEIILLTAFYLSFYKKKKRKLIIWVSSGIAMLMLLFSSVFLYGLNEYNVVGFFALKLFVIIMAVREIYWYQFSDEMHCYFINTGLLLSAVVNLAIFTFGNLLTTFEKEMQMWLWIFNAIVFIITLSLIAYELRLSKLWLKNQ